tara:strand:- start:447 stop:851 length:405 start_codon:yes stop_codon:yes gene_type:complete
MAKVRLYHATPMENLGGIMAEGIKPFFGCVYASTNMDTAAKWMMFTRMWSREIVVLPFYKEESEIEIGYDHSPIMLNIIGADPEGASYTCDAVAAEDILFDQAYKYENPHFNQAALDMREEQLKKMEERKNGLE